MCSSKKDQSKTDQSHDEMILSDSVLFEGKYKFRRILRDDGKPIYIKETTDFYSTGGSEKTMVIKSMLTVTEPPSWYAQYDLILEGYDLTNIKIPIWKKEIKNESPVGMWNGYFQTVEFGCCAEENGNRLYDINTGKEVLAFTDKPVQIYLDNPDYVFYHSVSATNFDTLLRRTAYGLLLLAKEPFKVHENIDAYTVQFTNSDFTGGRFEHTPDFDVQSKYALLNLGYFRGGKLFKKGLELTALDTADSYLRLVYDQDHFVLIPFDEQKRLRESEAICNDKEFSLYFLLSNTSARKTK